MENENRIIQGSIENTLKKCDKIRLFYVGETKLFISIQWLVAYLVFLIFLKFVIVTLGLIKRFYRISEVTKNIGFRSHFFIKRSLFDIFQ